MAPLNSSSQYDGTHSYMSVSSFECIDSIRLKTKLQAPSLEVLLLGRLPLLFEPGRLLAEVVELLLDRG
jgi:hypothetical protein